MIGIPYIVLLGLIEAIIVLLAVVVLLGIKVKKGSKSVPEPEKEEKEEKEEESSADKIEALNEKIRALESELEKARSVEKSSSDQKSSEPETMEETGETEETIEAEESVSTQAVEQAIPEQVVPEEVVDKGDNVSATPQDVVLMNSLQIKILREQQVELASVLETLEILEQGSGAQDTANELARLKGVDNKISEIIIAFEKENFELKQLVENWDMDSNQAEENDELATSRVRIAELQEELNKTKEEITSLEHEYDVLFKKTNG